MEEKIITDWNSNQAFHANQEEQNNEMTVRNESSSNPENERKEDK